MKLISKMGTFTKRVIVILLVMGLVTPSPVFALRERRTAQDPGAAFDLLLEILTASGQKIGIGYDDPSLIPSGVQLGQTAEARSEARANWQNLASYSYSVLGMSLKKYGLKLAEVQYAPLTDTQAMPLETLRSRLAWEIVQGQAIAAANYIGMENRFENAEHKKIIKNEADGNSVSLAAEFLNQLAEYYGVRIIVIGNEGAKRDKAPAIPNINVYNPNGKNGTLLFINDAVEGTNYLMKGQPGAWSIIAILDENNSYSTDGYRATLTYRAKRRAETIDPVLAGPDAVRSAFEKIAAANDQDFKTWAQDKHIVVLDRKRHVPLIDQLKQLTADGLTYATVMDGDFAPRVLQAAFGIRTNDNREVVVIGVGGANEHKMSLVAASLTKPDADGRKAFPFSRFVTSDGLDDDLANADNFPASELAEFSKFNADIAKNRVGNSVKAIDPDLANLTAIETEESITGKAVVLGTSITGSRPEDSDRYPLPPISFELNPDGSGQIITVSFLTDEDGNAFLIRSVYKTNDLFKTRMALLLNNTFQPERSIFSPKVELIQRLLDRIANLADKEFETLTDRREYVKLFTSFRRRLLRFRGMTSRTDQDLLASEISDLRGVQDFRERAKWAQHTFFEVATRTAQQIIGVPLVEIDGVRTPILTRRSEARTQPLIKRFGLKILKPTSAKEHFQSLDLAVLNGLIRILDSKGRAKILAMDQSGSMKKIWRALHKKAGQPEDPVTDQEMIEIKTLLSKELAPYSSAFLNDIVHGIGHSILFPNAVPTNAGMIIRLEKSVAAGEPAIDESGWNVNKLARIGDAVKILTYIDLVGDNPEDGSLTPEQAKIAQAQLDYGRKTYLATRKTGAPLLWEALTYEKKDGPKSGTIEYARQKADNVIRFAELASGMTDILKLEFPGDILPGIPESELIDNLKRLKTVAQRPWVMLSAGEDFDTFFKKLQLAVTYGGAIGSMSGRAFFKEISDYSTLEARQDYLNRIAVPRMQQVNQLVDEKADTLWTAVGITDEERIKQAFALQPRWHEEYAKTRTRSEARGVMSVANIEDRIRTNKVPGIKFIFPVEENERKDGVLQLYFPVRDGTPDQTVIFNQVVNFREWQEKLYIYYLDENGEDKFARVESPLAGLSLSRFVHTLLRADLPIPVQANFGFIQIRSEAREVTDKEILAVIAERAEKTSPHFLVFEINLEDDLYSRLGFDSLGIAGLSMDLEDAFDITLEEDDIDGWTTVGDVLKSVKEAAVRSEAREVEEVKALIKEAVQRIEAIRDVLNREDHFTVLRLRVFLDVPVVSDPLFNLPALWLVEHGRFKEALEAVNLAHQHLWLHHQEHAQEILQLLATASGNIKRLISSRSEARLPDRQVVEKPRVPAALVTVHLQIESAIKEGKFNEAERLYEDNQDLFQGAHLEQVGNAIGTKIASARSELRLAEAAPEQSVTVLPSGSTRGSPPVEPKAPPIQGEKKAEFDLNAVETRLRESGAAVSLEISPLEAEAIVQEGTVEASDANKFLQQLASFARTGVRIKLAIIGGDDDDKLNRAIDEFFMRQYGFGRRSVWQPWRSKIQTTVVNTNVAISAAAKIADLFLLGYQKAQEVAPDLKGKTRVIAVNAYWNGSRIVEREDITLSQKAEQLLGSLLYRDVPDAFYQSGLVSVLHQSRLASLDAVLELMAQVTRRFAASA